jgi:polyhydroxybutyrate depolymerase
VLAHRSSTRLGLGRTAAALFASALVALTLSGCASDDDERSGEEPAVTTTTTAVAEAPADDAPVERPELPDGREIEVQVPSGYDPDKPAPLVVLLHGYGVDGPIQNAYFKLGEVADANGMLAVFPSGTENSEGDRFWNATDACCAPPGSDVDDSGYLLDVINTVKADYSVDPKRVYLMGHSNGGFMAFRMACDHAEVIAGIAALAASTFADTDRCNPSEPVATLQVHGTADDSVRYEGEVEGIDGGDRTYPGALETLEIWATYNGCDLEPDEPAPAPRAIIAEADPATVIAHSACDPGGHAELWTAPDGVHIPAITPDFTEQVVEFLLAHPKP